MHQCHTEPNECGIKDGEYAIIVSLTGTLEWANTAIKASILARLPTNSSLY